MKINDFKGKNKKIADFKRQISMKFRLTQPISLQRWQTFIKPTIFVACLVGITTIMVGLMDF